MFLFIILGVPGILAHTVPKEVTKVPQAEGREKKKGTHIQMDFKVIKT